MLSPLLKALEQILQVNMVTSLLFQCGGGVFLNLSQMLSALPLCRLYHEEEEGHYNFI